LLGAFNFKEIITMTNVGLLPQKSDIWWVFLPQGFAGIILGLMLVTEPGATIVVLTTVLGFCWLITGLLGLVQVSLDLVAALGKRLLETTKFGLAAIIGV
jgi:uncharacterized membrane protein HdeD (DUF308 family)